ncbi:hypothetical protein K6119_19075 [Paracrocinitomix mangrovi]|uniref:hypothetical protein n=1 Tax=Paracrocinitomix mangrovi TaxID=2862509 RepID=UPI001C8DDA2A|nr:hypothetical protein [Paracrocinitomix mangrovi]UKN01828.1 hypothetical protein K6119_19075 [Paracrocinitomix mangrovi]
MKKVLFGILTMMVFAVTSCELGGNKPCLEEKATATVIGEFPDSVKVGDNQKVGVKFLAENSCGEFKRFDITQSDNSFEVKLITEYEGCNCNLVFTEREVEFEIDIDFPGEYQFKFWQSDGDYDTHLVRIYE